MAGNEQPTFMEFSDSPMPYALFFHARRENIPTERSLVEYFSRVPFCSMEPWDEEVPGLRFFYRHEETGANCSFLYERGCDQPADYTPEGYIYPGLSFRMNTARPSYFALEAMPLVAAFCRRFDLLVDDPQYETLAPADERELVRSWMEHNLAVLEEMRPYESAEFVVVPVRKVMSWWRYVRHASDIPAGIEEGIAVPYPLWSREEDGGGVRLMAWNEGESTLFPPCEYVHLRVEDARGIGLPERIDGITRYDELVGALRPYLTEYETPAGLMPALLPGSGAPLGSIIGACRLSSVEPLYTNVIQPEMLCDVDRSVWEKSGWWDDF